MMEVQDPQLGQSCEEVCREGGETVVVQGKDVQLLQAQNVVLLDAL